MSRFQPIEFLDFAVVLRATVGSLPKPRQRSAVSRSYYAAFLSARDKLATASHIKLGRRNPHDDVWKAFTRGHPSVQPIGRTLLDLKGLRETSDYDMDAEISIDVVDEAIALARKIVAGLATADVSKCANPRKT